MEKKGKFEDVSKIHKPVMLQEVTDYWFTKDDGIYLDATFGAGGHSSKLLTMLSPKGRVYGIDQDNIILKKNRAAIGRGNLKIIHDNFISLDVILHLEDVSNIDGILFDVGLSSFQIDSPKRGFSYIRDEELDMRMDTQSDLSALDVVNGYDEESLANVIYNYGEERFSRGIAKAIVRERKENKIISTLQLAKIVSRGVRGANLSNIKRVFQAIRIEVNDELNCLSVGLNKALNALGKGGRIVVLTFHSLEDRIVKNIFKDGESKKKLKILTKKPLKPSIDEITMNSRAKSAKLRVGEKI